MSPRHPRWPPRVRPTAPRRARPARLTTNIQPAKPRRIETNHEQIRQRPDDQRPEAPLQGVNDALLVNMVGHGCHQELHAAQGIAAKKINVLVVKNSLARRATEGTPLAEHVRRASTGLGAVCLGGEDIVALAKVITELAEATRIRPRSKPAAGVMDGESSRPSRSPRSANGPAAGAIELACGPDPRSGSRLVSQLIAVGGALGQPDQAEMRKGRRSTAAAAAAAERSRP